MVEGRADIKGNSLHDDALSDIISLNSVIINTVMVLTRAMGSNGYTSDGSCFEQELYLFTRLMKMSLFFS